MSESPRRITLLTDFGTADGYVAAVKGVLATNAPGCVIDDAAHDIPPGDVAAAAWTLAGYCWLFPSQTVHLAVVDPGVGSTRRALAAAIDDQLFVAPDNGLLTPVLARARTRTVVEITNVALMRDPVSATFHGRDIFAPAAAHLARGGALEQLGGAVQDVILLPVTRVERNERGELRGAVVHVDRFGNLITNIPASDSAAGDQVIVGSASLRVQRTYADVASGEALALIGSRGVVEISVRDGSAAAVLGAARGAEIVVQPGHTDGERLS